MQALQIWEDAAITIELWAWERACRRAMSLLEYQLQAAGAVAAELLSGRQETYHTVRTGETLQSIAQTYLGSWSEWQRIAAANGLKAGPVPVGTTIIIPQRS